MRQPGDAFGARQPALHENLDREPLSLDIKPAMAVNAYTEEC
jgi:hypothetical protein